MVYLSWISSNDLIGCGEGDAFDLCLGDKYAIERILVDRRQSHRSQSMLTRDCKLLPAVLDQGAPQPDWLCSEIFATEATLDGYFPKARGAEPKSRVGILEKPTGFPGQFLRVARRPQQQVSIYENNQERTPNWRSISS